MTKKELQKMIDNFQKEVTRKDYEIDRLQRLNETLKNCQDVLRRDIKPRKRMVGMMLIKSFSKI